MNNKQKEVSTTDMLDLIPEDSTVKLGDKEYNLRRIELNDEAWMARTFGDDLQIIFTELRMPEICKIVFHQMKDKADFTAIEVTDHDDDGVIQTRLVTGPELLMRKVIGKRQQFDVVASLLKTLGFSRPILDEAEDAAASVKKKRAKKVRRNPKQTGAKSLTS